MDPVQGTKPREAVSIAKLFGFWHDKSVPKKLPLGKSSKPLWGKVSFLIHPLILPTWNQEDPIILTSSFFRGAVIEKRDSRLSSAVLVCLQIIAVLTRLWRGVCPIGVNLRMIWQVGSFSFGVVPQGFGKFLSNSAGKSGR
jgi:hypothetical protein